MFIDNAKNNDVKLLSMSGLSSDVCMVGAHDFAELCLRYFSTNHFQIRHLSSLKALFAAAVNRFSSPGPCRKLLKETWKGVSILDCKFFPLNLAHISNVISKIHQHHLSQHSQVLS